MMILERKKASESRAEPAHKSPSCTPVRKQRVGIFSSLAPPLHASRSSKPRSGGWVSGTGTRPIPRPRRVPRPRWCWGGWWDKSRNSKVGMESAPTLSWRKGKLRGEGVRQEGILSSSHSKIPLFSESAEHNHRISEH